jgi:hypothetical protein
LRLRHGMHALDTHRRFTGAASPVVVEEAL